MPAAAPDLPTRFPCWCRAVYSWGGETDKDLGFMEGDLIECLNAGDGSWWTGRLRRDKRIVGVFPSNFVVVLDNGFQPASRAASPMPGLNENGGGSISRAASPMPDKKKICKKPFQGYKNARAPGASATPPSSRPSSKDQEPSYDPRNPPSTVLWNQGSHSRRPSRTPSPMPDEAGSSPPPPAPPPHKVGVGDRPPRSTPSPQPFHMNDRYQTFARTPSPRPTSLNGHTPPMLRDAMDDVMSSLQDMEIDREHKESKNAFNPWSPDAFDDLRQPITRPNPRPLTSLGLGAGGSNYENQPAYSSQHNSPERYEDGPPQLSNYVQRMESRLRQMHAQNSRTPDELHLPDENPPEPPPKNSPYYARPESAIATQRPALKNRKSAYELGKDVLARRFTTKSSATDFSSHSTATNSTTNTSMTSASLMSGYSAGGFSATSAGSLARRNNKLETLNQGRSMTSAGARVDALRPQTPSSLGWTLGVDAQRAGALGGLSTPKMKKTGFFKKLIEGAKTGAASARSSVAASQAGSIHSSRPKSRSGLTGIAGGLAVSSNSGRDAAREMGLGGGNFDWMNVRIDVNRANSPSAMERQERAERCQMLDHPVIRPLDELTEVAEGDEGADGHPTSDDIDYASTPNLHLVDKASRFISSLPPVLTSAALAQNYVCRPHRSEVQRLRAIFTFVSEKITWDDDFEDGGPVDTRRVIQSKRGSSLEVACLVHEMCSAIGITSSVVRGYLKAPGEELDLDANHQRPNHNWNAVIVEGCWRIMDCSLASPTHPRRFLYSSTSSQMADGWYFLARPMEICFTHVPADHTDQHIVPAIAPEILLALPCALPSYFNNTLHIEDFDTSQLRLEGLEVCTLHISVPNDVDIVAEVEAAAFYRDQDGDVYENGDTVRKRALCQPSWHSLNHAPGSMGKRFTIKAILPSDEGRGVLKVYAGKKGLMHSAREIPYPLAFAVPILHTGENPPYEFLVRHPTPHALRNDLYVCQPQCRRLRVDNTFVFAVRQHRSEVVDVITAEEDPRFANMSNGRTSPNPFLISRPSSAMSMRSISATGSDPSTTSSGVGGTKSTKDKPAKLAIQSPSGKILKFTRRADGAISVGCGPDGAEGSVWETVIKIGERGIWRGLVLADRSARWCVWGEWECI
ncbi:MAG: hypothetical protein Q9227_004759 [Pyrenula ochraceoflavens]